MIKLLNDIEGIKLNKPDGAFYIFPDISAFFGKKHDTYYIKNADDLSMFLLEVGGVSTVSGTAFGNNDCIRISYAASRKELTNASLLIKNTLNKLH
jgi:aspartate aminotransferase